MLRGVLVLHDIRDVEAFTLGIIQRSTLEIPVSELEDAHAFLIGEAWIASERFDPERHASFQRWCGFTLHCRLIDWHRARNGQAYRNGNQRPHIGPLPTHVAGSGVDPAERSDADLVWLLRSRAGTPPPGHPSHRNHVAGPVEG